MDFSYNEGLGAEYSFEVKNIEIWVPTFFKHNNSSVATVSQYLNFKTLLLFAPYTANPNPVRLTGNSL